VLDAELAERPADLGLHRPGDLPAGLGRVEIVAADHRPARPLLAMRRALRRRPHQSRTVQVHLGHRVAQLVAVPLHQLLVEMLHREIRVAPPVQVQHPRDLAHAGAPIGRPPQTPIRQTRRPLVAQTIAPSPERPLADPQNLRRLMLAQLASFVTIQQCLEAHPSYPLVDPRPVHPRPLFGAVLKPDTSRATNSGHITS
jgi:hypothetical protein